MFAECEKAPESVTETVEMSRTPSQQTMSQEAINPTAWRVPRLSTRSCENTKEQLTEREDQRNKVEHIEYVEQLSWKRTSANVTNFSTWFQNSSLLSRTWLYIRDSCNPHSDTNLFLQDIVVDSLVSSFANFLS